MNFEEKICMIKILMKEEMGLKYLRRNSPTQLSNSLILGDFYVLFTWKNGRKCRAYLLIVLVVANPYVSPL